MNFTKSNHPFFAQILCTSKEVFLLAIQINKVKLFIRKSKLFTSQRLSQSKFFPRAERKKLTTSVNKCVLCAILHAHKYLHVCSHQVCLAFSLSLSAIYRIEKRRHARSSLFSSPLPKNSDAPMVAAEIASARAPAPRRKLQDMQIGAPPTNAEKCESNNWRAAS